MDGDSVAVTDCEGEADAETDAVPLIDGVWLEESDGDWLCDVESV